MFFEKKLFSVMGRNCRIGTSIRNQGERSYSHAERVSTEKRVCWISSTASEALMFFIWTFLKWSQFDVNSEAYHLICQRMFFLLRESTWICIDRKVCRISTFNVERNEGSLIWFPKYFLFLTFVIQIKGQDEDLFLQAMSFGRF